MKKTSFRKIILIVVLAALAISAVAISALSISKYNISADTFIDDGYMLLASNNKTSESINEQHYFNAGEKYRSTIDNTVVFEDVNGNKVSAEKENFIHYQSGSMNALAESVVLDADRVDSEEQASYYSVPAKTLMNKNGTQYTLNNAGNNINFSNFIWKLSTDRYMVVSPTIDFVVSENSEQSFTDFVELRYIDEGVVHLVTQDGTYSTVSSDAYLQLANGIRIYIGSKNISNDEQIIMNLSQMVVGSDDNIEVIPDEDYTIESDEKPQIVINANDGEEGQDGEIGETGETGKKGTLGDAGGNGENGTSGDNGENGDNGNPGSRGSSGGQGTPGKSAPNADVIFEAEVMPQFIDLTLSTKPYGVTADVGYYSNQCSVKDAWVSIVDVATGNEVWKKNVFDAASGVDGKKDGEGKAVPFEVNCDTLMSNTQYRFNIHATYASPNYPDQVISQIMTQEIFYTDSYGFELTKQAITSNSIALNLTKNKEAGVKYLRIKLFDENLQEIGYFDPVENTIYPVDTTHSFEVDTLEVDDSILVRANGLYSNSIYYAQIQIMLLNGEVVGEPTIVPTNSYPKQKYLTLKVDPIMQKPTVRVDEVSTNFIVTPGSIIDKDNGITSYRLEIYELDQYTKENATPSWTYDVQTKTITNISVPITDDLKDTTKLHRNVKYCAHIVAIFDNNEEVLDFRSPVSDDFIAGEGKWPTVRFDSISDYITPSTMEGNIVIIDTTDKCFAENSVITVEYVINEGSSTTGVKNKTGVLVDRVPLNQFSHSGFEYTYPISGKSFKANQEYTLVVKCTEFYIDGIRHGEVTAPETVSKTSFTSKEAYSPMLISSTDVRTSDTSYSTKMFAVALKLAPSDLATEETLRTYTNTTVPGLHHLGDLSGRSVTYLKLELYPDSKVEPGKPDTTKLLKTIRLSDCNNYLDPKPNYEDDLSKFVPIWGETQYGYKYNFDTSIYSDAYCNTFDDEKTITGGDFKIVLTDTFFTDKSTGENPIYDPAYEVGAQFYVKVTAYDYTYGLGEGYNISGPNNNNIKIGTLSKQETYDGTVYDSWIEFNTSYAVPEVPQIYPYCKDYISLTKAETNLSSDPTYYEDPGMSGKTTPVHYNNVTNAEKSGELNKSFLETLWTNEGIAGTTMVGITYSGPAGAKGLAQYCSPNVPSVLYNVYKLKEDGSLPTDADGNFDPSYKVATSGWLEYKYGAEAPRNTMPTYTFFYDVKDKTTGKSVVRGEDYIIETKLVLKGNEHADTEHPDDITVYPDYWHSIHKLPKEDPTDIHTYIVFDELISPKEVPIVLSIPFDATSAVTADNSDTVYLVLNDPDMALDITNSIDPVDYERVNIYQAKFDESIPEPTPIIPEGETEKLFGIVEGKVEVEPAEGTTPAKYVYVVKGDLATEGNLYAKYCLTNKKLASEEYTYVKLLSEENVVTSKSLQLVPIEAGQGEFTGQDMIFNFDGHNVEIDFRYKTSDDTDENANKELLGVDIIFTKYICNGGTPGSCPVKKDESTQPVTIFEIPTDDGYFKEEDASGTHYTHKAKLKLNAVDIANIIKGSESIGVDLKLYYDTGDYGIRYFDNKYFNPTPGDLKVDANTTISSSHAEYDNVTIDAEKILTINSNAGLYVRGNFTNNGTLSAEEGALLSLCHSAIFTNIELFDVDTTTPITSITGEMIFVYKAGDVNKWVLEDSISDEESSYYLIQYADKNGKAIIPSSTKYPKDYYKTTKKKGIESVTNLTIKDLTTQLFTRDEVVYNLNDYKINVGDISKHPDTSYSISAVGLNGSIIKKAGSVTGHYETKMSYIMPTVVETGVKTGYSTALISFKVLNSDTVLMPENLYIEYQKEGETDWSTPITIPYSNGVLQPDDSRLWTEVAIENLNNATGTTKYNYRIKATVNNGSASGVPDAIIFDTGKFSVVKYEHLDGTLSVDSYVDGSSKTRDSKHLIYKLVVNNVITSDMQNALSGVELSIFNNATDAGNNTNAIASTTIDIAEILPPGCPDYYSQLVYDKAYLDWAPMVPEDIRTHIMDGDKDYTIRVKYIYRSNPDFDTPHIKTYHSRGTQSSSSITGWSGFKSKTYYSLSGVKNVEVISGSTPGSYVLDYQLIFTINGKDVHRLLPVVSGSANNVTYVVELIDAQTGEVVKKKDNTYQRQVITASIDKNNSIQTKKVTFKELQSGHSYKMNLYYVLDDYNIDIKEIQQIIAQKNSISSSEVPAFIKNNVTVEGIKPADIVTVGSGVYTLQSIAYETETGGGIKTYTAILHPESNEALILGNNMSLVKKINYQIRVGDNEPKKSVDFTGTKLAEVFRQEPANPDLYYLTVPELTDTSGATTYSLTINFYGSVDQPDSSPSSQSVGVFPVAG